LLSLVPNLLTLLRIAACPVLILVLNSGNYQVALLLFLASGITDGLDGFIAKRFNCVSKLGAILDPIADKLLISSAYVMLALLGDIPFYLLVVVIFRDLVIVVGYLVLLLVMKEDVPMRPIYSSKFNTFLQIILVVFVLFEKSQWLVIPYAVDILIIGVIVTSVLSGSLYVWHWGIKRDLRDHRGG
jgi:cardiolipin synthase